jgi:hypothetical protein
MLREHPEGVYLYKRFSQMFKQRPGGSEGESYVSIWRQRSQLKTQRHD